MAITLKALKRDELKRSATKEIRDRGDIPAVVYGKEKEPRTISVNSLELTKTVRDNGINAIMTLDIDGGDTVDVMLHDYQMHPLKNEVLHADFYVVDLSEEMDVAVPVRLEGTAQGDRDGGILQQPLYELQVRAIPSAIPEEIVVDVTELEIGDTITVADLPVSDDYEYLDEEDTPVAVVLPPEVEEETEDTTDVSVEPELVGAEDEEEAEEN